MDNRKINKINRPDTTALDIAFGERTAFLLDSSSYLWGWGYSNVSSEIPAGITSNQSTPVVAVVASNIKFTKLCGFTALDASSYAWCWGPAPIGNGTSVNIAIYQSVAGGMQWKKLGGQRGTTSLTYRMGLVNGYAWGWGTNDNGSLGNNTANSASSPVSVVGGLSFIDLDVSADYTIALDTSSYAWAWGNNTSGQLGDNTTTSRSSPVSVVGNKQFISVITSKLDGSYNATIALDTSSYAWAWGYNNDGEFGNGTTTGSSSPISVHGPWNSIYYIGSNSFLGINNNGYYVWGYNASGAFGNNTLTPRYTPLQVFYPFNIKKIIGSTYSSYGTMTTMALDTNGYVWAWGDNTYGSMGNNSIAPTSYPTRVYWKSKTYTPYPPPPLIGSNLGEPGGVEFYLDQSSYAWCWGTNSNGALGINIGPTQLSGSSYPVSVVGNRQFRYISGISNIGIGLDLSSYAWVWGYNGASPIGNGSLVAMSSPVSVIGGKQWSSISVTQTGAFYGIDNASFVWAWGANGVGECGQNTTNPCSSPVSVIGGRKAISIAAYGNGCVMLDISSYAWCWGANSYGQCGQNNITNYSSPVSVVGGYLFTAVATSNTNCYALDISSYAWAWGVNGTGLLGNNSTIASSSPVSVAGGHIFMKLLGGSGSGSGSMAAIDSSSYLWSWGSNTSGVLGDGTTSNRSSPVSVIGGYLWDSATISSGGIMGVGGNFKYSNYIAWGSTAGNRLQNYNSTTFSSPIVVTHLNSIISNPVIIKTNIFGQY